MSFNSKNLFNDFMASVVVFLVALPLCMGIAIASGVPPALGLIAGILGGLVVGLLGGSPLQVSGPAAGLAVMVFEMVKEFGIESLYLTGIIVGVVQILAGVFKLGKYFTAVSPALIKGMLSGIGALILGSQFHVMLDDSPKANGILNLATIPEAFINVIKTSVDGGVPYAATVGIITIAAILIWSAVTHPMAKKIPAPLLGVVAGTAVANLLHFPINYVPLPENLFSTWDPANIVPKSNLISFKFFLEALAMAFVASAETLLSVNAVDRLTKGRSNYSKEIFGQGIANFLSGILGALPVTGVIVRSATNIESGGRTKLSAILHGCWLLLFCLIFPNVLRAIPVSALASVLVIVGWKLLNIKGAIELYKKSKAEAAIFFITISTIVSIDLLSGVIAGFVISLLITSLQSVKHKVEVSNESNETQVIKIHGRASFLNVPHLSEDLHAIKTNGKTITLDLSELHYMDSAVQDQINDWVDKLQANGKDITVIKQKRLIS